MTEVRELSRFHSVDLRSLGRVVLASGPEQKVEVEAEEDLQSGYAPRCRTGCWWSGCAGGSGRCCGCRS